MTEEYKENVFKYLTNNLLEETGNQQPKINNISSSDSGLYNSINSYYQSMVVYIGFVPSKDNENTNYSVLAVYGQLIGDADVSGGLAILDEDYNVLDLITTYSDGEKIGTIQCINVDDKGNYYLVEKRGNNYRIVLLNNLVMKPVKSNTYKAVKVETYSIPNQYTWDNMCKVFKSPDNDKYFVVATRSAGTVGIHLEVSTTTWTYYTSTYKVEETYKMFNNGYNVYWDNDGSIQFQMAAYNNGLVLLSKGTGTTMNSKEVLNYTATDENYGFINYDFVFYTNTKGFYLESSFREARSGGNTIYYYPFKIFKINLEDYSNTLLCEEENIGGATTLPRYLAYFIKKDNRLFYYENGLENYNTDEYATYFGVIDAENNKTFQPFEVGTYTNSLWLGAWLFPNVYDNFNNISIKLANRTKLFEIDMTWNPENYSGLPYESLTSLIPQFATLEDENEIELYNRNLYNLTAYSNGYNATLQIPNNYLNTIELTNANLYSKNSNLLVGNSINTTKNQYEELFINFINKFNIYNEGELNINASNNLVSAMLNKQIEGHLGKIKINYADETNDIRSLTTKNLIYTYLDNGVKTTLNIMVYTNKLINNIELISEDETISYSTIDCSNMELSKYYLITQDVRIE